jgi:hypothetical protein
MKDQKPPIPLNDFEIIRSLKRGFLSLWLNRRTLLPMTLVPTIVTFLTLMIIRGGMTDDVSVFTLAILQIPSDFVTGLFCALIIYIILSAPKKKDTDKPVVFTLDLNEQKKTFVAAALAYVVFSYLANGLFGFIQNIYEPMAQGAEANEPPSLAVMIGLLALIAMIFYGLRFILLPILIINARDVKSFYLQHKAFSFSIPLFAIKAIATFTVGICVLMLSAPLLASGEDNLSTFQMSISDLFMSFGSVIASAWTMASLAIGYRQFTEGKAP